MGWAAAVAIALAASSTPRQFNLECAGTVDVIYIGGQSSAPYKRVLRIDLAAKQWCADQCAAVEPIASVQPNLLILRDVTRDTPREYWRESESVNRVTGGHSSRASDHPTGRAGRSSFSEGICKLAPFTGFASGVTKF
jgi:hypothetical protein